MKGIYQDTRFPGGTSRIRSRIFDAIWLSLRQPATVAEPEHGAVRTTVADSRRSNSEAIFDPDYEAFRATLLSLAQDGHRMFSQMAQGLPEVDTHKVHAFLQRVDQFDEQVALRGLEPLRQWVHHLKRLILDKAATRYEPGQACRD